MSALEIQTLPMDWGVSVSSTPAISAAHAVRKANGYLGKYVGMFFGGAEVAFVATEPPVWRVKITFQLYEIGPFSLGTIDVNAMTGEVISLSNETILDLQSRANALAQHSPSPATPIG